MSQTPSSSRTGRSAMAILLGILVVVVLSIATDAVLHAAAIFPKLGQPMSDNLFLLATAYRTVYGVLGGYVTARLAPNRPMRHALLLGLIGVVLATIGAVATWNKGLGPRWYPVALIVLALPQCWLGGAFRVSQLRGQPEK
jgi:uncharacterized membrane protein